MSNEIDYWKNFRVNFSALISFVFFIFAIAGLIVIGIQFVEYLKNGVWVENSVIDEFKNNANFYGEFAKWAYSPKSWIGIHIFFQKINFGFCLLFLGVVFSFISFLFHEKFNKQ